ncbi:fla cluster protein FlaF [halophilic archaeon]|uniref:fla cluster protein FlaF n=1 Tax=Halomicrococcus sp. SG-WS-1 TaxID=3439057 RepID=UPI000DDE164D|nr:fla cluster protein FlaF [halophilic archaeon]
MGFSVSGATAILFIAMFVSFGVLYTATYNGFERVTDARNAETDRALTQRNTAVNVTDVDDGGDYLNVTVNNTGSTALNVNDTDLLVNGSYVTSEDVVNRTVEGDGETSLWLPGETLRVEVDVSSDPWNVDDVSSVSWQVKVVTGPGVADTEVV